MVKSVGFYISSDGNYRTSRQGLTLDQIQFLRSFSVGDQMTLFINDNKEKDTDNDLRLVKSSKLSKSNTPPDDSI